MKKIICALLACVMCASVAASFSGCGCESEKKKQEPGYVVKPTEPKLSGDGFGYIYINSKELMITQYTGGDKNVKVPSSYNGLKISAISRSVFKNSDIESVEIAEGITEIQDYAFASAFKLKSVKLPESLKKIGPDAFFHCTSLESIEIPKGIKTIDSFAFSASGLKSITIPESKELTSISEKAFYQCQDLKDVHLPATITDIKKDAFGDCPNKLTFYAPAGTYAQNYAKQNNFDFKVEK